MSGNKSRRKGAVGERELVRLLREELGEGVCRNLSQTRDGGRDCLGLPGVALEVKRCEEFRFGPWIQQANAQAEAGELPVVAWRRNGGQWRFFVEMDLLRFCELVRENCE